MKYFLGGFIATFTLLIIADKVINKWKEWYLCGLF